MSTIAYLFNKYLSPYCVPGPGDTVKDMIDPVSVFMEFMIWGGQQTLNQNAQVGVHYQGQVWEPKDKNRDNPSETCVGTWETASEWMDGQRKEF